MVIINLLIKKIQIYNQMNYKFLKSLNYFSKINKISFLILTINKLNINYFNKCYNIFINKNYRQNHSLKSN